MKNNRLSRWQATLVVLDKIDTDVSVVVQRLAKLDCRLIQWSKKHNPKSKIEKRVLDGYEEYSTISYLWVLGAYEIIRTIHERCRKSKVFLQSHDRIKTIKEEFARLRMPLAKLEAQKNHKQTDHATAFSCNTQFGISWLLGKGGRILRIDLSDKFLELLESLKK